jgi:hypothetical protein
MGTPASAYQGALLAEARHPDTVFTMGDNPALPTMPSRPTLKDFFQLRFSKIARTHLLQSARVARENGLDEKVIMACLLHDIAIAGLLSANHGTGARRWSPRMWMKKSPGPSRSTRRCAISRTSRWIHLPGGVHQLFRARLQPARVHPPGAEAARRHRWYMTSRLVTINDIYSFDPTWSWTTASSRTWWPELPPA